MKTFLGSVTSPVPPPRRHNPFNKSTPTVTNSSTPKITFRELHTAYSRRILTDLNEWRHQRKQSTADLISF